MCNIQGLNNNNKNKFNGQQEIFIKKFIRILHPYDTIKIEDKQVYS